MFKQNLIKKSAKIQINKCKNSVISNLFAKVGIKIERGRQTQECVKNITIKIKAHNGITQINTILTAIEIQEYEVQYVPKYL